jgi:hypothetical protein
MVFAQSNESEKAELLSRIALPDESDDLTSIVSAGCIILERSFGCPTNLDDATRVELVIEGLTGGAECELNAQKLNHFGNYSEIARFEVAALLKKRNILRIKLIDRIITPFQAVRLEIFN